MTVVPQFGEPIAGRAYPDRPAAFAVVEQAGRIAVVRVDFPDGGQRVDLPGGGIDAGEGREEAVVRECGEEAGLRIVLGPMIALADHFFLNERGLGHNTRGAFYAATVAGEAPELKIEDDHTLIWLDPLDALVQLERGSHVWAVACWLRLRRRA